MTEPSPGEPDLLIPRLARLVLDIGSGQDGRSFAKTQILLHAMAVFNRRGLEETAVQDILDAAQISRRTFYKYFSGKLDVLESLYGLSTSVLMTRLEGELAAAPDRAELVRTMIGISFDYQFSFGHIIAIMMEEAMRAASPLAPQRLALQDRMLTLFDAQLQRLGHAAPDPWLLRGLVLAVEASSLQILTRTAEAQRSAEIRHCREQMLLLWERALG